MMDFPVPVSPVSMFSPKSNSRERSWMTAKFRIRSSMRTGTLDGPVQNTPERPEESLAR